MSNTRLYKTRDFECGVLFQTLRNKTRLRQQDIASILGVSVNTVQYWEGGTTYPKVDMLKKLLEVYLRFEVFIPKREMLEAEELWEKVRLEAPRLNALFDREWFRGLLESVDRTRQLRANPENTATVAPNNLPKRLTSFIGRKKELMLLSGRLKPDVSASPRQLVTLTGEGGCGKTSLGIEVARESLGNYPQGVWLVELAPLVNAYGVTQAIATTLGLKEQPGRNLLAIITDYLREKQILLILDNCEHVLKECARVVESLLRDCPQLLVLATSREALKVTGEKIFRVPSLTLPPVQSSSNLRLFGEKLPAVEGLLEYEAVQLFVERGKSASPLFELNEQNLTIVAELCRRLDGIPLAIELAAARLRVLSVVELNERLAYCFRLLRSTSDRTVFARHETLRATMDWSYELLTRPEQTLFRQLAVFAGGWTWEAAEKVCVLAGLAVEEILHFLHELVNKSLVIVEEEPASEVLAANEHRSPGARLRFRMLETLKEYGQERLEETISKGTIPVQEKWELQTRHLLYYRSYAVKCAPPDGEQQYDGGRGFKLLAVEQANMRTALDWIIGASNALVTAELLLAALELAVSSGHLWNRRGYYQENYKYLSQLKARAEAAGLNNTVSYAWLCLMLGKILFSLGDSKQAQQLKEETLELFTTLGDRRGIAQQLNSLAVYLKQEGQVQEAEKLYRQSLLLAVAEGATKYVVVNLSRLGWLCIEKGECDRAVGYFQEGLKTAREYGDPLLIGEHIWGLGALANFQGDYAAVETYFHEALALFQETGHRENIVACLNSLGALAHNQRDYLQAKYYYQKVVASFREIGHQARLANVLFNLALVALAEGNYEEATAYNQEALDIAMRTGYRETVANCQWTTADIERRRGNYKVAITNLRESLKMFQEIKFMQGTVGSLLTFVELSMDYFNSVEEKSGEASKVCGYVERAVLLAGVVESSSKEKGRKLLLKQQEALEQFKNSSRQQLGEDAFEQLFAEGQAMSLEEGVAYALSEMEEGFKD